MNTYVVGKSAAGEDVNSDREVVIECKTACGRKTTMTGTEVCDHCWEAERRVWRQGLEAARELA